VSGAGTSVRTSKRARAITPDQFWRQHPGLRDAIAEWLPLAVLSSTGQWDQRADDIIASLNQLSASHADHEKVYRALFRPDVDAAIATRDMPRLARALYHFINLLLLNVATDEKRIRDEVDARIRDGGSDIPFERFCALWHELPSGNLSARAKYVSQNAGGHPRNHLNRYRNNRPDVDAWLP
jgi:hypothetical protein